MIWSRDEPLEGAKGEWFKKACHGSSFQKMLMESPQNSPGADFGIMWRVEKDKMQVATGVTWTESERGPRMLQQREYLPREFRAIFVDDRPFTVAHSIGMQKFNQ